MPEIKTPIVRSSNYFDTRAARVGCLDTIEETVAVLPFFFIPHAIFFRRLDSSICMRNYSHGSEIFFTGASVINNSFASFNLLMIDRWEIRAGVKTCAGYVYFVEK